MVTGLKLEDLSPDVEGFMLDGRPYGPYKVSG